jgi:hypothetical protein
MYMDFMDNHRTFFFIVAIAIYVGATAFALWRSYQDDGN